MTISDGQTSNFDKIGLRILDTLVFVVVGRRRESISCSSLSSHELRLGLRFTLKTTRGSKSIFDSS